MAIKITNDTIINSSREGTFDSAYGTSINAYPSSPLVGTVSGFTSGGGDANAPRDTIDKFPFSVDVNATDVGNLYQSRFGPAGQSSTDYGYSSGGFIPYTAQNTIDKFPFSAPFVTASDVGNLTSVRYYAAGQSSFTHGYTSGGYIPPAVGTIDKFPFASDANASYVGSLNANRYYGAGQSSEDYGYTSGGQNTNPTSPYINNIDKFPFSSDFGASDVGDLTTTKTSSAGQSSTDYGYVSAGFNPSYIQKIEKFPFNVDVNSIEVGDLVSARRNTVGQSSTDYGYTSGGSTGNPSPPYTGYIDKFPFASDADATGVGSLSQERGSAAGQQD